MAADILLYQTHYVPVGEDQRQHLELARDVVRRFNEMYRPTFIEPRGLILTSGSRIMSLTDGTQKMSKSHSNDLSRINLLDSPEVIQKKIRRCKTDSISYLEYGNASRPECNNLLNMYQQVTGMKIEQLQSEVNGLNWSKFKPLLADAVVEHLKPIQDNYTRIIQDQTYLNNVLSNGRRNANKIASETLMNAKDAMGFYHPTD